MRNGGFNGSHALGGAASSHKRAKKVLSPEEAVQKLVVKWWPALPVLLLVLMLRWRILAAYRKASLEVFVKFSCYRIGGGEFAAVGLAPLARRGYTKFKGCYWEHNSAGRREKRIPGRLKSEQQAEGIYPGEHHDLTYEALIIRCTLQRHTHPTRGGKLTLLVDGKPFLVYHEQPDAFPVSLTPAPPFKHHVTFCSPPLHSKVEAKRVYEWLEYHLFLGVEYFIFYDAGGVTEDVLQTLLPYELQGLLEVRDVSETLAFDSWLYGQVMLINDCAYSTRFSSQWTMFFDLDEFFNADTPPPPEVKKALILAKQKELNAAEHWQRQVAKLQRKSIREKLSGGARREGLEWGGWAEDGENAADGKPWDRVEGAVDIGAEGETSGKDKPEDLQHIHSAGLPHPKKFSLEERQKQERTEEAAQMQKAVQQRQEKNYQKLKKKKGAWQRPLSKKEKARLLEGELKKQKEQLERLKEHREHLKGQAAEERMIPLVLDTYAGAAYITFGTMWWDIERCVLESEAKGDWAIQRMLYHWPHIYCMNNEKFPRSEACLDYFGHRKYAVDPRKISALQIHRPEVNDTWGLDLDTSVAKMNHFQGLINLKANSCNTTLRSREDVVWWARGEELSSLAQAAQASPRAKFAGYQFPGQS